jgi:hypothetical protein
MRCFEMSEDIYVVVATNDREITFTSGRVHHDDGGPLVFEQYTRTADLESIKKRSDQISHNYGPCRIAKLVFIDGDTK